jgi:ABC-type phosphate transport system auxiliary subunit
MAKKGESGVVIDWEELKKLTGKNSDYAAAKAAIMAGYECLKNHSGVAGRFAKLIKEIEEMPLSQIEKKLERLRLKRLRLWLKEGNNG